MPPERDSYAVLRVSEFSPWPAIRAAYRDLARRYHPDGATPDTRRMAEINAAYEHLEREHRRRAASSGGPVDPDRSPEAVPAGARTASPPSVHGLGPLMRRVMANRRVETPVLDFGQYAGWRIGDIATHDPGYLRWLSRHSSGVRFRPIIEQVLGADSEIGRRAALVR